MSQGRQDEPFAAPLSDSQTYREVLHQPAVWRAVSGEIAAMATDARSWVQAGGVWGGWGWGGGNTGLLRGKVEGLFK